jgi:hypothetical protein
VYGKNILTVPRLALDQRRPVVVARVHAGQFERLR